MRQLQIKKQQEEQQKQVLSILMMRFGLNPYRAIPVAKRWLEKNSDRNWSDLAEMLAEGKITFKKEQLKEVNLPDLPKIVNLMKSETEGIELKNRRHKFKLYKKTFLGFEAVEWLIETAKMSRFEAINFGQMLIDRDIIYSVANNNNTFQDDNSLYGFCEEEKEIYPEEIALPVITFERGFDWGDISPIG